MIDHQAEYENNRETISQVLDKVDQALQNARIGHDVKPSEDDDPMERFAEAAAYAVEQCGEDIMRAATQHRENCKRMAEEIRHAMSEMAKATRLQLNKIKTAAHRMKEAREEYENFTPDHE